MRIFLFLLLSGLITACASSNLTSSWVDKNYTQFPIKSTVIVAMSDNLRIRRIFEDEMVNQLRTHGVNAVASSSFFPNELPSKSDMEAYVKKHNTQSVFVAKLINIEDKEVRYPGNTGLGYNRGISFYNYYNRSYSYIYDDSYTVSYEYVNVEFTLFDTKNRSPIWSTSSESVDPSDINNIINELTGILAKNMKDNGVIQ